jgi:hypothetical protein
MHVPAEFLDQQHHQPHLPSHYWHNAYDIHTHDLIQWQWLLHVTESLQMQKSLNKRYVIESVEIVLHDSLNPKLIHWK